MSTQPKATEGGTPPVYTPCQCEHIAHLENKKKRTPKGAFGHKYWAQFPDVQPVKTLYGTYHLCKDCREDCHAQA